VLKLNYVGRNKRYLIWAMVTNPEKKKHILKGDGGLEDKLGFVWCLQIEQYVTLQKEKFILIATAVKKLVLTSMKILFRL
jgi:hypothetical protein